MLPNLLHPVSILWITDPEETLDRAQDTTLRLGAEALNRGVRSWWSGSDSTLDAPAGMLKVRSFERMNDTPGFDHIPFELVPAAEFDQIHYRVDPPVDAAYRTFLESLLRQGVKPEQIHNPLDLITTQSEKLPPPELLDLAPRHRIIASREDALHAYPLASSLEDWVSKPMNLAQSIGVKRWKKPASEQEFLRWMDSETGHYSRPVLVEEFLKGIEKGEVRMWFAMGEFIGALKKHPIPGDFRVLVDQGSRIEPYFLDASESEAALRVGASLKRQRISLAAIDFIDGLISDYNITSPGLLVQLEKAHGGANFARRIIDLLLNGFEPGNR